LASQRGADLRATRANALTTNDAVVLLPTYNEKRNLPVVARRLAALDRVDVIIIDDNSPDGTGAIADEIASRHSSISVLHRERKDGLGPAYIDGIRSAFDRGYRKILTMDADLSHAPEDIPRLLDALDVADVAVGSRFVRGANLEGFPLWRRVISKICGGYARALLDLPVVDGTSGFRGYRAEALRSASLERIAARGFVFQVEILARVLAEPRHRVAEIPIEFRNRTRGRSKLALSMFWEGAASVLRLAFETRLQRSPTRAHAPAMSTRGDL